MPRSAVVVFANPAARQAMKEALVERLGLKCSGDAASPAEALLTVERTAPDIIIIGQHLVDARQVLECRALRAVSPGSRLISLIGYIRDRDPLVSLLAGASACLLLEIGRIDALAAAIDRVAAGENLIYAERGEQLAQLVSPRGPLAEPMARDIMARVLQLQTDPDIAEALALPLTEVRLALAGLVESLTPTGPLY